MNTLTQARMYRQLGLSTIELLVAGAVSLILLAGVVQVYSNSRGAYRVNEGQAELQENATFALSLFARQVRLAGYRAKPSYGYDAVFVPISGKFIEGQAVGGVENTASGTSSDILRVRYQGNADGTTRNCQGGLVTAASSQKTAPELAEFYIGTSTVNNPGNVPGLFCRTAGNAGVELVRGVENFQVLVGENTVPGVGGMSASRYVRVDQVSDWDRVVSVRIGLLLRTSQEVTKQSDSNDYVLAGSEQEKVGPGAGAVADHAGGRFGRRVVNETLYLPNLSFYH